jgi:hypothetical protein
LFQTRASRCVRLASQHARVHSASRRTISLLAPFSRPVRGVPTGQDSRTSHMHLRAWQAARRDRTVNREGTGVLAHDQHRQYRSRPHRLLQGHLRDGRTEASHPNETRALDSSTTSLRPEPKCGYPRSAIYSHDLRLSSTRASATVRQMRCAHAREDLRHDRLPKTIRVDQESEFVSRDLDLWEYTMPSRLTSVDRGSRRTMPTSRRLAAASGRSA